MIKKSTVLLLTFLTVANCFGQTGNSKKRTPSIYSNWMSIDYLNCLTTNLPCECEKPREYFLSSLDTTKKFVLLYYGETNHDYDLYDLKTISPAHFEVYDKQDSPTSYGNTIAVIGHIKINSDTLLFIDQSGKQTKFITYGTGENDSYFKEHIKLLNSAMTVRAYDNLNKTLKADSLKCVCNWELGGINLVFGNQRYWILEKKEDQLLIYEWTNPPSEKMIDLKINKKLLKTIKW